MPILDACEKFLDMTGSVAHSWELLREAIREGYNYFLTCAQSRLFTYWESPSEFHWFYALSYNDKPWFSIELWEWARFDWKTNFEEILRADNLKFFEHASQAFVPSTLYQKSWRYQAWPRSLDAAMIIGKARYRLQERSRLTIESGAQRARQYFASATL